MNNIRAKLSGINQVLVICFILIFANSIYGSKAVSDEIHQFLTEYVNGKPSGTIYYVEIKIYNIGSGVKWIYNETEFVECPDDTISVSSKQSRSDDNYSEPILEGVVWIPGKSLQWQRNDSVDIFNYKAIKNKDKKYDWTITAKGKWTIGSRKNCSVEHRGSKKIDLKNRTLRLVNLYYNK